MPPPAASPTTIQKIFKYTKGSNIMIIMDEYRQQLTATIAALKQAGESL